MRTPRIPKYSRRASDGQAVVYLPLGGGKYQTVYLGKWDTPRSRARYDRVIGEYLGRGRAPELAAPDLVTVEALAAEYLAGEARRVYQQRDPDSGKVDQTEMYHRVSSALRPVVELFGQEPAAKFGTRAFKAVRDRYVEKGYTRRYCNALANCLRAWLRWAITEELIPSEKAYAAISLKNWRPEQTTARDNDDVEPADLKHVRAVQKVVARPVRDLIELQLLTGCRPGEACRLRLGEVDRSGPIWLYRPRHHKTARKGKERIIHVGPRAQKLLAPYLRRRAPEEFVFSPREAELERLAGLGQELRTNAGGRYQVSSYSRAIRHACDRLALPRWHPHQLRHNAATNLVDQFGEAIARTVLGHATLAMTRHYDSQQSKKKLAAAARAIKRVG